MSKNIGTEKKKKKKEEQMGLWVLIQSRLLRWDEHVGWEDKV